MRIMIFDIVIYLFSLLIEDFLWNIYCYGGYWEIFVDEIFKVFGGLWGDR